jgi:hypothetical protein
MWLVRGLRGLQRRHIPAAAAAAARAKRLLFNGCDDQPHADVRVHIELSTTASPEIVATTHVPTYS